MLQPGSGRWEREEEGEEGGEGGEDEDEDEDEAAKAGGPALGPTGLLDKVLDGRSGRVTHGTVQ